MKSDIDGEWVDSEATQTRDVVDPGTDEVIAHVPLSTSNEVERAVRSAQDAFESWREAPPARRARDFFTLKNLMEENFEDLSRTIVQEMGKTIDEARGELKRSINFPALVPLEYLPYVI